MRKEPTPLKTLADDLDEEALLPFLTPPRPSANMSAVRTTAHHYSHRTV
jgi:hypothetical protein